MYTHRNGKKVLTNEPEFMRDCLQYIITKDSIQFNKEYFHLTVADLFQEYVVLENNEDKFSNEEEQ